MSNFEETAESGINFEQRPHGKFADPDRLEPGIEPRWLVYLPLKFVMEWCIALMLVAISAPLVLFLAIMVKSTSAGPAFYAQTRLGSKGRHYKLFKLRTMVQDAEAKTGPVWAAKNDVRTTRVGRFLRKTHLDELPQLWNVLRGEMGLIGPRPERPEIAARLEPEVPGYRLRLQVRPGITGLAQMLVPADDPTDHRLNGLRQKIAHDVYYVREVSLLLDMRIAFSTVCYFLSEAIDSIQRTSVNSYGKAVALHATQSRQLSRQPVRVEEARSLMEAK